MKISHVTALTALCALGLAACGGSQRVAERPAVSIVTTSPSTLQAIAEPPADTPLVPATRMSPPAASINLVHPSSAVCVNDPGISAAEQLNNLMLGTYGPLGNWLTADIGGAIQIGDSTQWMFWLEDTMWAANDGVHHPSGPIGFTNNSALIQDGHCYWVAHGGTVSSPKSLVLSSGDRYYWPQDGYVDNNKMYVWMSEIAPTGGTGMFAFHQVDTDLAVFDLSTGKFDSQTIVSDGPWDNTPLGMIDMYPAARIGGEQVMTFVTHNPAYPGVYMAKITDPSTPTTNWAWWNGTSWSTDPASVVAVAPAAANDNKVIRPYQTVDGRWVSMAWSWTAPGGVSVITSRIYESSTLTGPYIETSRTPITPLPGSPSSSVQYWHTIVAGYPAGTGVVLQEWANTTGNLPSPGEKLMLYRPTFKAIPAP